MGEKHVCLNLGRKKKKRIFLFFLSCGATPSRAVPRTQPLRVGFFLLERVDLRSQKGGDLGEEKKTENCLEKGGVDRAKKRKKDAPKKGGKKVIYCSETSLRSSPIA